MFFFQVHRPTTFFTDRKNLMILDNKGNPFYWHTNKEHHLTFNLPIGKYYTEAPFKELPTFQPYGKEKYPSFKFTNFLRLLSVVPHKNKNKASISLERHLIIVDPKFYYHSYKPLKVFTLKHEVYHKFFHAKNDYERNNPFIHQYIEKQCDRAARNWMLANGYNPTQVSLAINLLLRGKDRKETMRKCTTDKKMNFRR